jgi:hypothetical protein
MRFGFSFRRYCVERSTFVLKRTFICVLVGPYTDVPLRMRVVRTYPYLTQELPGRILAITRPPS